MDDFSLLIWELLSVLNQHFRDLLFKLFRVTTFQKRPLSTSYVIPVLSNPSLAVTLLILQLKLAFKTDREILGTLSDLRVLYRTALQQATGHNNSYFHLRLFDMTAKGFSYHERYNWDQIFSRCTYGQILDSK